MLSSTSLEKLKKESVVEFYKSSGPGGQRKNKRETAVRIRHVPTGIVVVATESRSQAANIMLAYKRLMHKLEKLKVRRKPRIPTKIPRSVAENRLLQKKRLSIIKKLRTVRESEG